LCRELASLLRSRLPVETACLEEGFDSAIAHTDRPCACGFLGVEIARACWRRRRLQAGHRFEVAGVLTLAASGDAEVGDE
jgi:hypothetical protein